MTMPISDAIARLAIARGSMVDDLTSDVYLDALADVSPELVRAACLELSKLPRADYETALPSVGTIREYCDRVAKRLESEAAAKRLLPVPKGDQDGPRVFCPHCQDEPSGWYLVWCHGSGQGFKSTPHERHADLEPCVCARRPSHPAHSWAVKCSCVDVNPIIAKSRARMAAVRPQQKRRTA